MVQTMAGQRDMKRHPMMIRLRPDIGEAAKKAAIDDHRSLSSLIEAVLAEYLKKAGYLK